MMRKLVAALAPWFVCACTGDTGTLNLFPEPAQSGGAGGSACTTEPCDVGAAGGIVTASGGTRNGPDAAMIGHHDFPDAAPRPREAGVAGACSMDRDCRTDGAQFCAAGRCVECRSNGDCTSGDRQNCSDGRCVQCRSDDDCTPDKPGCVLSAGRCDDCSKDSQCEPGERCNVDEGKCR